MNKKTLLVSLLALSGGPLCAQSTEGAPAPKPPFVAKAPDNSSWVVRFEPKKKAAKQPEAGPQAGPMTGAGAAPQASELEEIRVAKAGTTRRIVRKWSDGKAMDAWYLGPICLGEMPGQDGRLEVVVFDASGAAGLVDTRPLTLGALSGADYSKGDFPEFNWIRAEHFAGIGSPDSNPYFIFRLTGAAPASAPRRADLTMPESLRSKGSKSPAPSVPSAPPSVPAAVIEARIDCATKLPLSLDDGSHKRTYTFSMEPPQLTLPPRFDAALKEFRADLEAAKFRRMP